MRPPGASRQAGDIVRVATGRDRRNRKLSATQVFLGNALYALDPSGAQPPRLIAKDLGGLNGFVVGPDGMIYGPLWFERSAVRVDPANGEVSVISASFETPATANLDGNSSVWVIDSATGELSKVALDSGATGVAVAADGSVCFSADRNNAIDRVRPQR